MLQCSERSPLLLRAPDPSYLMLGTDNLPNCNCLILLLSGASPRHLHEVPSPSADILGPPPPLQLLANPPIRGVDLAASKATHSAGVMKRSRKDRTSCPRRHHHVHQFECWDGRLPLAVPDAAYLTLGTSVVSIISARVKPAPRPSRRRRARRGGRFVILLARVPMLTSLQ